MLFLRPKGQVPEAFHSEKSAHKMSSPLTCPLSVTFTFRLSHLVILLTSPALIGRVCLEFPQIRFSLIWFPVACNYVSKVYSYLLWRCCIRFCTRLFAIGDSCWKIFPRLPRLHWCGSCVRARHLNISLNSVCFSITVGLFDTFTFINSSEFIWM